MMKSERLNVAVAPEVKALWQSWADKKGMSLSNFIRHCVNVCVSAYEKQERDRKKQRVSSTIGQSMIC